MKNSKILACCLVSVIFASSSFPVLGQVFNSSIDQSGFNSSKNTSTSAVKPTMVGKTTFDQRPADSGIRQVGWFPFTMPKVALPKMALPQWNMPKMPSLWPTKKTNVSGTSGQTGLMTPVTAGANKVRAGTQRAWNGTKQMFSFGRGGQGTDNNSYLGSATQMDTNKKPSMWKRMFTPAQPERNDPRTITEWMSQPRPKH